MIEVTCYAPDRATAAVFLKEVGIAQLDPSGNSTDLVPIADVQIHPFREAETITIVQTPAVYGAPDPVTGMPTLVSAAALVPGFHFNLRFYGESERLLTDALPQVDAQGALLGLFERTHILDLVQAATGKPPVWKATEAPVPAGYESDSGVRAFDPATIKNRRNVFA